MTLDEDAAKVIDSIDEIARAFDMYEFGLSETAEERQKYVSLVAAFGRRCAEAMREECAKACHGQQSNAACIEAIQRVEVK